MVANDFLEILFTPHFLFGLLGSAANSFSGRVIYKIRKKRRKKKKKREESRKKKVESKKKKKKKKEERRKEEVYERNRGI